MANSEIKVGLKFSADVSRAKQDIKSLESTMSDLMTSISRVDPMDSLTDGLGEARQSAQKLQAALQQSVNIKTGQFDLSKFSKTLKDYGTNLKEVSTNLQKLGPEGEAAFNSLTSSIVSAEIPAKRVNKTFAEFTKQLKNVARYQISTKIYNELVGSLEQAWIYAKNLNKSLNDIRIVTNYSVDDMAKFAEKANAAARALSSTTNEYAKASLIYFQQGLSDAEVEQRTATTIKLANVTGQSAQEVSEYMTAVWNNFDDGTKSLEYYADAITKLGAATASSSEEIATGLQKFSAVAQSVGLSYEYATSMLATVTSQTRESAETVGTSFKTILARFESLSLGETLDDETTMTKYSQALAKVGVSIKDQNGALKDMDTIIQEIGETWKIISADQRIALAQTVAGMRQYNNFIALMDNYDTFQMNVQLATDSEGSLQEQADIYAESWEAASKRVEAAAEEVYDKLINDEFFIDLLNVVEQLIGGFSDLIDKMGGVPGLLSTIGFVLTQVFHKQIGAGIASFTENLGNNRKNIIKLKEEAVKTFDTLSAYKEQTQFESDAETNAFKNKIDLQLAIAKNEDSLNESQRLRLSLVQQEQEALRAKSVELAKQAAQAEADYFTRKQRIKEEAEARHKASLEQLVGAKERQNQLQGNIEEYGNIAQRYSVGEIDEQAFFAEINKLAQKVQDSFDISVDEGAGAFVDKLKEIKTLIIDTLRSVDEGAADKFKESVKEEFSGQSLSDDIQYNRARQFAKESDMDYGDSVQVIKQIGQSQEKVYEEEKADRESGILQAGQRNLDMVEAYKNSIGPELEKVAEDKAFEIRDSFMSSDLDIDKALKELETKIVAYGEEFGESEPEIAKALEEFYLDIEEKRDQLLHTPVEQFSLVQNASGKNNTEKLEGAAELYIPGFDAKRAKTRDRSGTYYHYLEGKTRYGLVKKEMQAEGIPELSFADAASRRKSKRAKVEQALGNDAESKAQLDAVDKMVEANETRVKAEEHLQEVTRQGIKITEEQTQSFIEGAVKAGEGVMGLVSAFNMLKSVQETLNDPNKDLGEKFTTSMTSLLAVMPMVISSFNSLVSIKTKDQSVTLAQVAAQGLSKTAAGATIALNKMLGESTDEVTKAKWAENAAWYASPILWIPVIIAAAVAALALLGVGIKKLSDALSASAKAGKELEEAQNSAKELDSALSSAKEKADALKTSFNEYDTIQDQLAKCVRGTDEWTEALNANNEKVLELMKEYPELATMMNEVGESAISRNTQTGALEIADWAMRDLETNQAKSVETLNTASITARADVRRKEVELDKANIVDGMDNFWTQLSSSLTNPLTYTAVGIADQVRQSVQWKEEKGIVQDNMAELLALSGEELDAKLEALGVSSFNIGEWSDQIEKYASEFPDAAQKLASAMDANTLAAKAETDVIKQQLLSDNSVVQGSQFANQIIASTSTDTGETVKKRTDAEIEALKAAGWGTKNINQASTETDEDAQEIWKEYAKAAGLSDAATLTGVTGADDNRGFTYKVWDEEAGEYKTDSIDLDSMMRVVASQRANDAIEDEAEKIAQLYGRSTKEQVDLMTAAAGDASYLSRSEIAKYAKQGTELDASALGLTDEQLKAFGGKEEFEAMLMDNVQKAQEAWEKTTSTMMNATQESLNALIANQSDNEEFAKLTDAQLQIYGEALDTMYQTSGAATQEAFSSVMDELIANNKDEADKIVEIASGIDWTSGEKGLIEFYNQLRDSGIEIDQNSERWQDLVTKMQTTPTSLLKHDFEAIREEIATIQELVNGISFGDIVSDEDFEKLRQYSTEVQDMFMMTADGYRFIGKSQELQTLALKQSQDALKESLGANKDAKAALGAFDMFAKDENWRGLSAAEDKNVVGSRAMYLRDNENLTDDMLAQVGFAGGKDALEELIDKVYSDDRTISDDATKKLQQLYANIAELEEKNAQGEFDNTKDYQLYASQFTSTADLQENYLKTLKEEGLWTREANDAYKQQWKYLRELEEERLANLDLYQDESKALEDLARKQEDLADAKEHATGQDYLDLLKQEIALEEERAKVYESGLSDARGQQQRASKNLNEVLGDANAPKAKLDENGNVTNWEELDRYMATAKVNDDQRDQYEEYKSQVQAAEDNIIEYTENIKDSEKAQRSMWIESATYAAEYNETIRDMELEWLEFQLGAVEDAEFSAAMGLANLSNKTRLYAESARDAGNSLNKLAENFGVAPRGEDESMDDFLARIKEAAPEAESAIQDIMSGYMGALQQAREADKELANSLVAHFEQVGEKFDKVNEQIGIMQNTASNYKNIIDLVGRENFDNIEGTLSSLNKMEQNLATSSLKTSKAKAETLTKDIAYAEEKINAAVAAGDMGTAETWRKTWETLKDQQQSAVQEMQESWTSALETAAAVFEESTTRVLDTFEKSMSGTFGSFDRMNEVFGQQSTLNNQYVADYKKVYELSKLTRNIQQTIDNSDSVAAKKEMRELQEEITQLQESGTEMSQYDLDYLQKKYDLRVAEIALEEAQNAKSQVRLQKMSDGSWGYVYTQNADAVANAQQNYEDKMFALQELSTNYLDTTSEQIIATQAEFQSAIETIMTSGLSDEEKKKQVDETVAYYQERLQFLTSEFDGVIENNQGMANMVQSFSESLLGAMYPTEEFDSADNIFAQFNEQVGDWESGSGLMGGLKTAMTTFQESTATIFKEAGYSSMEEFIEALNNFGTGGELSETMATLFNEDGTLKEGAIPGIDNIVSSVANSRATLQESYKSMYQDYVDYLNSMSQAKIDADGNVIAPELEFTSPAVTTSGQVSRAVAQGSERLYTFDTGGYTGSWGSEGKLAVLHEKELVLNKEDTSNLLHTMEIMDQLIKSIDLSAAAARMTSISAARISGDREALQQEVTIHAEFPNATDSSQIEAALNSLVNRAAQYANRNR